MTGLALLEGITVVELGDGVAGSTAAAMLARLGATVTTVVGSTRPRRHGAPRLVVDGVERGAFDVLGDADKRVVVEPVHDAALLAAADIVIEDCIDGGVTTSRRPHDAAAVWVTISPFGLDGPAAGRPGGELVAQAAGGLLATSSSESDGSPVPAPGDVAGRIVGHVAALAAMHGFDRHRELGRGVHVDVSAQEAVVAVAALPECAHVMYRCPGQAGSGRYLAPSGLFPCRDGFARITAVEDHQWKGMTEALGRPDWTVGLDERAARIDHAERITAEVTSWTSTMAKADVAALLQAHRVPATAVDEPWQVLSSPQRRHRGTIRTISVDGHDVVAPAEPWVMHSGGVAPTSRGGRVVGLRVLELTHVLAGPIVGALLGGMGADVVRLEDLDRPDIYRRSGPFADGEPGPERGAYFAVSNHSKRSVSAGGDDLVDAAARLAGWADVVIENVGLRRLARIGLDPTEVADGGDLMLHVSGFGVDGPLAEARAYANNVQSAGGLAWMTRDGAGELARLGTVMADPLSSVVGATVIAAWALGPARARGAVVDLAMAEVVTGVIAEHVVAATAAGALDPPRGADHPSFAPHGVVQTSDGAWVAIAVSDDAMWEALVGALDGPAVLDRPEWGDAATRHASRDEVIDALRQVAADRPATALVEVLAEAGVAAAVVLDGAGLVADPHLEARGAFPVVDHPGVDGGRLVGLPWRPAGAGAISLQPPPALGSSTVDDILEESHV